MGKEIQKGRESEEREERETERDRERETERERERERDREIDRQTERGDFDFCLSRSHYTDTDPISKERAATAGIVPATSSPRFVRSIDRATMRDSVRKTKE